MEQKGCKQCKRPPLTSICKKLYQYRFVGTCCVLRISYTDEKMETGIKPFKCIVFLFFNGKKNILYASVIMNEPFKKNHFFPIFFKDQDVPAKKSKSNWAKVMITTCRS